MKGEYERKQPEESNEYLSDTLIGKFSEFMEGLEMIENAESTEEELAPNKMIKRDLKVILGYVTPFVALIGLLWRDHRGKTHDQQEKIASEAGDNGRVNTFVTLGITKWN